MTTSLIHSCRRTQPSFADVWQFRYPVQSLLLQTAGLIQTGLLPLPNRSQPSPVYNLPSPFVPLARGSLASHDAIALSTALEKCSDMRYKAYAMDDVCHIAHSSQDLLGCEPSIKGIYFPEREQRPLEPRAVTTQSEETHPHSILYYADAWSLSFISSHQQQAATII